MKLFYATTAPANFVEAHRAWAKGEEYEREVAVTFSSQVEDFVSSVDGEALMISGFPEPRQLRDGRFEARHMPRQFARGWRWYREEYRHARALGAAAKEFGADVALIDSGTMPFRSLIGLQKAGMKVIPVFHNTLYKPTGPTLYQKVERPWARRLLESTTPIHVSPACKRQVGHGLEIRAQYRRKLFEAVPPASFKTPFNILYVGRVSIGKGVLDIAEAARMCGPEISWTICGTGEDIDRLRQEAQGLPIDVRGWTSLEELTELRSQSQAMIAPTRKIFEEGMAMSAVEAILSGRPLITNAVVPALEVLRPACIEVETENPRSIAEAALSLARDRAAWQKLVDACAGLQSPFYDRRHSLTAALMEILYPDRSDYVAP